MNAATLAIRPDQVCAYPHLAPIGRIDDTTKHGHIWRVSVTLDDGSRFEHDRAFREHSIDVDHEFGESFVRCDARAPIAAEALAIRVARAGMIDLRHWSQVRPAYGSDAYAAGDWEALERAAEIDAERRGL
ncbi:MAG: hypothetical protein ACOYBR_09685 [Fluviibacter sp.]